MNPCCVENKLLAELACGSQTKENSGQSRTLEGSATIGTSRSDGAESQRQLATLWLVRDACQLLGFGLGNGDGK